MLTRPIPSVIAEHEKCVLTIGNPIDGVSVDAFCGTAVSLIGRRVADDAGESSREKSYPQQ